MHATVAAATAAEELNLVGAAEIGGAGKSIYTKLTRNVYVYKYIYSLEF